MKVEGIATLLVGYASGSARAPASKERVGDRDTALIHVYGSLWGSCGTMACLRKPFTVPTI